jgi:hypothetical protein
VKTDSQMARSENLASPTTNSCSPKSSRDESVQRRVSLGFTLPAHTKMPSVDKSGQVFEVAELEVVSYKSLREREIEGSGEWI